MAEMPESLAEIVEDFAAVDGQNKLQLLLEFSRELPELPAHLEQAAMEPVPECQSPLFLSVDSADTDRITSWCSSSACWYSGRATRGSGS